MMPLAIDHALFRPREKRMQIAYAPRKMGWHAEFIRKIFIAKFPAMRSIPWVAIENVSEARAAEIMGESAVYLSTSNLESFGLMPLEAMSAGCAVVGFHGYGGLEYMNRSNGLWFYTDELEETADALYRAVKGIETGDALIAAMIGEGGSTAARYTREAMRTALVGFIEKIAHGTPAGRNGPAAPMTPGDR